MDFIAPPSAGTDRTTATCGVMLVGLRQVRPDTDLDSAAATHRGGAMTDESSICGECAQLDTMLQQALQAADLSRQVDVRVLRRRHAPSCPLQQHSQGKS